MKLRSLALAVLLVFAGVTAPVAAGDDGRPLADAGLDQTATVGSTVYLDGGGSLDPDGEIVAYNWSIETPDGATITPADPTSATTRFIPEEVGRYYVTLTVTGDDGKRHSDTLYVDVERSSDPPAPAPGTATPSETTTATTTPTTGSNGETTPRSEPTPSAESTPNQVRTAEPEPTAQNAPDSTTASTNQPPNGAIRGPSSGASGSSVTYTIDATDPDGEIVDRWWLPTALSASPAAQSELRSRTRSLTVDGTPGTTAEISAIVVDDDGATATLTKSVDVRNTHPSASIEGDNTAVVNSTKTYRLVASDPDGQITSVSLTSDDGSVEAVAPMPWRGPTSSGEWARSFRFTEIPADDGTVTLEATVRDEHGGVTRVEKVVTVVDSSNNFGQDPLNEHIPKILSLEASFINDKEGTNSRQVLFTAEATDPDSNRLTFDWRIGDVAMLSNRASGDPAQANISYSLEDLQFEDGTVSVSLIVTDQNGNDQKLQKTFELERPIPIGGNIGRANQIQISHTQGRTVYGRYQMNSIHAGEQIFISFGDEHSESYTLGNTRSHQFKYEYSSAGRYAISISPSWTSDSATAPVNISQRTYTVWHYEQNKTEVLRTKAAESPGEDWARDGIARIDRKQIGVETTKTRAIDDRTITSPGQEWARIGTTIEYHTEQRRTESTSHPGGNWALAERNIDRKQVFIGWEHTTVPRRGLLGTDWEYVKAVPYTVQETETQRSADRPSGSGWSRGEQVGKTQVDYSTRWVDYRFHANADWQYLGADRYISGYDKTTTCVEYIELYQTRHCVEEETNYHPEYDYRYEYRVPEYDPVYEWERSVEETNYDYRYRAATYEAEAIHAYTKEVRVGTEYIQWKRPVFEKRNIYRWKNTQYTWHETRAFSKPSGDVRNLTKVVKQCGTEPADQEPNICSEGD
ncbi:PKD domain protein [Halolamina pelagica]|uniref:PKD domain protein n=1 Tax=Halolamina pelagica TaxID=699431 RepID=A0A0P7HCL9_9EURY|nr:PKD domain-containing protein [Halolamina pelagica]KPN31282.1 PKD domain protein [Halolamina pelagica]